MKTLYTRWGKELDPEHVLSEYPRPMMRRKSYVNLNGYWDYRICKEMKRRPPASYEGQILVPFSPESPLSGVNRRLGPKETLWYHRTFKNPAVSGERVLIHFGAVDQMCVVYVNGHRAGCHKGGYLPFSVDATPYLGSGMNDLCVRVRDLSDQAWHAKGKQKIKKGGMFYTPQSGIWQTVWMEAVPHNYIREIKCTALYDTGEVEITVFANVCKRVKIILEERVCEARTNEKVRIRLRARRSWTPWDPYLYRFEVRMGKDKVKSYFAMRCVAVEHDKKGVPRICLNHEVLFQKGLLDQGYWPDGLYTAPSDEAMIFDIREAKRLGYNMLRKHCKIEPQRWYYHCDRLGILVWQDMVNGGETYHHWYVTYGATAMSIWHLPVTDRVRRLLSRKRERGRREFEHEMRRTVRTLYGHPSIILWTLFNEGWGQFDTVRLTKELKQLDPTRLVDAASGWFDQRCGDVRSTHNYFFRLGVKPEKERASVLSEFGGFSMREKGHSMCPKVYGYRIYTGRKKLRHAYENIWEEVRELERKGLCAAVYTQLSDIEEEVNGLWTYDREILKIEE